MNLVLGSSTMHRFSWNRSLTPKLYCKYWWVPFKDGYSCNFTVNDGKKSYIYAANDITAGRSVVKPDTFLTVQFFFGPAMAKQYDSLEYDPSKEYFLNINESYGNYDLPLKLTLKQ